MRSWNRNLRDIGWSLGATRNEGLGPNSICSAPNLRRAPTRPEAPTTLEARKRFSDQPGSASVWMPILTTTCQRGPLATVRGWAGKEKIGKHTSELQSHHDLVCRLLLEKKK